MLISFVGALGPVLGGVIAQNFGITYAILAAVVILLVAMIPLYASSEIDSKRSMLDMKRFSLRDNIKDIVAYAGYGLEINSLNILWPFLLYTLMKNYLGVGSIATISLMVMIASSMIAAKIADKYEKKKIIRTLAL